MSSAVTTKQISNRFRGFLPIVIDVETAGFDSESNALLEIAAVPVHINNLGDLVTANVVACHVEPFPGSILDPKALEFTGIDPHNPLRMAKPEKEALEHIFKPVQTLLKKHNCTRAILVGHNPFFDLGFIQAAVRRNKIKKNPFHAFSTFDTATLGGLAYGQTVLARAVQAAGLSWDNDKAHSAIYDAEQTAKLFCTIVNNWDKLIGVKPFK